MEIGMTPSPVFPEVSPEKDDPMLGSHPLSAILGADVTATSPTPTLRAYVKGLTDNGMYLLLCEPYTKLPADYRTASQKSADAEAERRKAEEERKAAAEKNGTVPVDGDANSADDQAQSDSQLAGTTPQIAGTCVTPQQVGTPPAPAKESNTEQKARGGVHMATNDVARLRQYITRARKGNESAPINLAFEVGRSGMMVVDCDTAAQREAFCDWFAMVMGDERLKYAIPTVLSPGEFRNGVWLHRDGGHYYFDVKNVELPGSGKLAIEHNGQVFDMFWNSRYILIPPSVRKEGAYSRVGPVLTLSEFPELVNYIQNTGAAQEARIAARREGNGMSPEMAEAVKEWYPTMSWEEILLPHGYTAYRPDACGCPTFTRNGGSNPKSVTCHVPGCSNEKYNHDDPPAHFWSTNVEAPIREKISETGDGGGTISKLQLFAALNFDGDESEAMNAVGIMPHRGVVAVGDGMFGMSAQVMGDGTVVGGDFDSAQELERTQAVVSAGAPVAQHSVQAPPQQFAPQYPAAPASVVQHVAQTPPHQVTPSYPAACDSPMRVVSAHGSAPLTGGGTMFGMSGNAQGESSDGGKFRVTVAPQNTHGVDDMFGGVRRASVPVPPSAPANPFSGVRDLTAAGPRSAEGYSDPRVTGSQTHNTGYGNVFSSPEHSQEAGAGLPPAVMSHKGTYGAPTEPSIQPSAEPACVTNPVTGSVTGTVTDPVPPLVDPRYVSGYMKRYGEPYRQGGTVIDQGVSRTVQPTAVPDAVPAPVTETVSPADTEKELSLLMLLTGKTPEQIIGEAVREYRERHVKVT